MILLLSIHPEYVEKILSGEKSVEYRRKVYKYRNWGGTLHPVDKILLYATSPLSKIVGEVTVTSVEAFTPHILWEKTRERGGIEKAAYDEYFRGCCVAYGIMLQDPVRYNQPLELADLKIKKAPQTFVYVRAEDYYAARHGASDLELCLC